MPDPFNPNAPCVIGNEYDVTAMFSQFVNRDAEDAGTIEWVVESTTTETVTGIWFPVDLGLETALELGFAEGWYVVEIYDVSDLGSMVGLIDNYNPSADTAHVSTATVAMPVGGSQPVDFVTSPRFDKLDSGESFSQGLFQGVSTYNDEWVSVVDGTVGFNSCYFGGIVDDLDGEQILSVGLAGRVDLLGSASGCTFRPFLLIGPRWDGPPRSLSGAQPAPLGTRIDARFFADPFNTSSWTIEGVEAFDDSVAAAAAGVVLDGTGDATNYPAIYSMWLEVMHRPEARVALGEVPVPTAGDWWFASLFEPSPDGDPPSVPWGKDAGKTYLVTLRRRGGVIPEGGFAVPVLQGEQPGDVYGVSVDYDGVIHQPARVGARTDGSPGLIFQKFGSLSVDAQPYASLASRPWPLHSVDETGFGLVCDLGGGDEHTVGQRLEAGTTDPHDFVRVLVSAPLGLPDEPLLVNLTGAVSAGPLVFESGELVTPVGQAQILEGHFPTPAALTIGDDVVLEFTSSASVATPWRVQVLTTYPEAMAGGPPTGTDDLTFGGAALCAVVDGADQTQADCCATLAVAEDPPGDLTATAVAEGDPPGFPSIDLTWDPVVLNCGDFGQYELDRSDDGGLHWFRIATIGDAATLEHNDQESVLNAPALYRIRVRRADGTPSVWSDEATATALADRCGYYFTSSWAPELGIWYDDEEHRSYDFLDDAERHEVKFAGREFQVSFYSLTYRGEQLTPTLLVAGESFVDGTEPTATPGVQTYDPLRLLAGNMADRTTHEKVTVPYVCVRTAEGDRWFSSIRTPHGDRHEPDGTYKLPVTITEATRAPAPVIVAPIGS